MSCNCRVWGWESGQYCELEAAAYKEQSGTRALSPRTDAGGSAFRETPKTCLYAYTLNPKPYCQCSCQAFLNAPPEQIHGSWRGLAGCLASALHISSLLVIMIVMIIVSLSEASVRICDRSWGSKTIMVYVGHSPLQQLSLTGSY